MRKALMQTGLKGETKGLGKRPDQESHDAPMMPPKVGGFALGLTVLMQGDDPGHTPGIFHHIGMVTQKNRSPLHRDRHALSQNQAAPVGYHGIKTPGRGMEKVE